MFKLNLDVQFTHKIFPSIKVDPKSLHNTSQKGATAGPASQFTEGWRNISVSQWSKRASFGGPETQHPIHAKTFRQ